MEGVLEDGDASQLLDKEDMVALERVEMSDEEDDNFDYGGVALDEFSDEEADEDEDLQTALRTMAVSASGDAVAAKPESPPRAGEPSTSVKPSVIDDFIRNFLIKMGLQKTLDTFNTEWYELQASNQLNKDLVGSVPDIYLRNQELENRLSTMAAEVDQMRAVAEKAQSTWDKFRKERDFHRMHHQRVVVEKKRLMKDLRRLREHYSTYEPLLQELRGKYEAAMKEKTLMRLERDRLRARAASLEGTLKTMDEADARRATRAGTAARSPTAASRQQGQDRGRGGSKEGRSRHSRLSTAGASTLGGAARGPTAAGRTGRAVATPGGGHPDDSRLPDPEFENPYATASFPRTPADAFSMTKTFKGHLQGVAALAFHPKKQIVATASDDETWKLWTCPDGELIMSGEGHEDWIAGIEFHPSGKLLATGSGDGTVKVWDLLSAQCRATFADHTQAVWDVAFHHEGDFLVSASMDHGCKMWDMNSGRARQTFRGHVDSVNAVCFQPFTNNICTASGDKTVSLWDVRSGLCVQTLYGHKNACNHVAFNLRGDTIASCDADGIVKMWDVRMVAERATVEIGPHPVNKLSFDRSGEVLAAASDDGTIKIIDVAEAAVQSSLQGHDDAVQVAVFDPLCKYLVSGSSDCTFRVWS